jgi:hypothetical protein
LISRIVRHWQRQPWLVAGIAAAMIGATVADILMPVFAGDLVDAVGLLAAPRAFRSLPKSGRDASAPEESVKSKARARRNKQCP